jgi:cell division protease FtsH
MSKPKPKNHKPQNPFSILFVAALGLAVLSLFLQPDFTAFQSEKPDKISLTEMIQLYENNELASVKIKEDKVLATTNDDRSLQTFKEINATVSDLGFNQSDKNTNVEIISTSQQKLWINILMGVGPFLVIILIFIFLSRRLGGGDGMGGPFGFGKSRARIFNSKMAKTKFSDVAGAEEAKEEAEELVDFLKNPKKYEKMGAKIPRGILLVGPPGTGKTLLARAIAGEANVPFFSVSGSEFVEMFVGVGASRVRDLFKTAKRNAPAIIFIDEIDAIGKKRGQGSGGGHDEREQTLNQILTEMDGFEVGETVIVMAATNRPDVLDKALLRPGRFDRRVSIDLPDMAAREKILTVHTANKKLAKDAKLKLVASKTVGFSGAELENVLNEAAIFAVKRKHRNIHQDDLLDAVEKVAIGPERRNRKFTEKEREMTSYHEVGHAIAGHFCKEHDPVHKISIISRGRALGLTWFLPEEDQYSKTKQRLMDEMVSLHGGRIAERMVFGGNQLTTGASNDLERITAIARSMITRFGMGSKKIGPVCFHHHDYEQKPYSEETGRIIDLEIQELINAAELICEKTLEDNLDKLHEISKDLLVKENINREEFLAYFS